MILSPIMWLDIRMYKYKLWTNNANISESASTNYELINDSVKKYNTGIPNINNINVKEIKNSIDIWIPSMLF